jgi:pilus assembly protein CpaE
MDRVLVVHQDPDIRKSVEQALRRMGFASLAVFHAQSPTEVPECVRRCDPGVVLLGLDEGPELALDTARILDDEGRLVVGMCNRILGSGTSAERLLKATRAGVRDFLSLPVSDADLAQALRKAIAFTSDAVPSGVEGRAVAFYSNKGGAGTTTLAVNVAVAMAMQAGSDGRRPVLFDADLQFGCACDLLGLHPDRDAADLAAELNRTAPIGAYLVRHAESALHVLPSPRDLVKAETVTPEDAGRLLIALRRGFDPVVVDLSSRMDAMSMSLLDLSQTICVTTEAVQPTVQRTAQLLRLLDEQGFEPRRIRVALRRLDAPDSELPDGAVEELLGRRVDWFVPFDRRVIEAANKGIPLVADRVRGDFASACANIARSLAKRES